METFSWLFAAVVMGGLIHILSIFGVPVLAQKDAWSRVSETLAINTLSIVQSPGESPLPFTPPDIVYAYCPFDISEKNLVVSSPLPEPAWSLSVSTEAGENFYLMTGADARTSDARILLVPRNRLAEETSTERTEEGGEQSIVIANANRGVVVVRAPLRGESFRDQTLEWMRKAKCDPQDSVEPPQVLPSPKVQETATAPKTPDYASARPKRYRKRRR